jgi:hypothetical protein
MIEEEQALSEMPEFLNRTKGDKMKNEHKEETEQQCDASESESDMVDKAEDKQIDESVSLTLDELLKRIKTMTEKRDALTEALSAHKKMAQKLIGRM